MLAYLILNTYFCSVIQGKVGIDGALCFDYH